MLSKGRTMKALGLMSGTSMDGIDLALVETDGEDQVVTGAAKSKSVPYDAEFARRIEAALDDAKSIKDRWDRPGDLADLEEQITRRHANAVNSFVAECREAIDVIGFHGQTVLHRPEAGLTVQLGNGPLLADLTDIPVVYDFRTNDMLAGGQGAPLVPVYHRALASLIDERPVAFVNIGGISNISYVGDGADLLAFDTGPGNALIDQWVSARAGIPFDAGGRIASEGSVVTAIVDRYLSNAFFEKSGPKSLDRNDFKPLEETSLELADGARTLARVTAEAIMASVEHLPEKPQRWVICGGGRLNETLMNDLRDLAGHHGSDIVSSEELGLDGDMIEAEAFAYLAARSLRGLPLTFPKTTGCHEPVTGGVLAKPHQP